MGQLSNMKKQQIVYAGRTAVVTGASSGIGEAFAHGLAAKGSDLVLIARREDKLSELASDLRAAHGVNVAVIGHDLSRPGAVQHLLARLAQYAPQVDILVNNAGTGSFAPFLEIAPEQLRDHTQLNVVAVLELTRALVPPMVSRGSGVVINLASSVAFMPLPYAAAYAASKAFVLSLTEAVFVETQGTGVSIIALCPGPTRNGDPTRSYKGMREPEQVVETAFRGLSAGAPFIVDGPVARQHALVSRLLPRRVMAALAGRMNAKDVQRDKQDLSGEHQ
jgi:short-subunit dehydrogenase